MSPSIWNYFNPVRVVFAADGLGDLGQYVPFKQALLVTTAGFSRRGVVGRIRECLGSRLAMVLDDVQPNPDLLTIDAQKLAVGDHCIDGIIALGGGSVMDTAKALARLLPQESGTTLARHFRAGAAFDASAALPVVTIPTTAGTGSEVTPLATVWDFEHKRKYSVTGPDVFPRTAILDPELTRSLPRDVTVSSGLDAVSHAFESVWNRNATPVTLQFATASLRLSLDCLGQLADSPDDMELRGAMLQASLLAGMAISQTRTALAHSISYPLTTHFGLPHGIACSFTLPALLRFNMQSDDGRLFHLAQSLGCSSAEALARRLELLFEALAVSALFYRHVPSLEAALGLTDEMFTPGRADNNLRAADAEAVQVIVRGDL